MPAGTCLSIKAPTGIGSLTAKSWSLFALRRNYVVVRQLIDRTVLWLSGRAAESVMLLNMRIALAEAFWRSGRTKVVEGKWLQISDSTYDLLRCDYDWIPLSLHPPLQNMYSRHCFWSDLPRVCRVARIRRA